LILSEKPDTYFRFFGVQFSMGVWFFFVLSGFLMSYLIDTGSDRFLIRRLVRIYPTYWPLNTMFPPELPDSAQRTSGRISRPNRVTSGNSGHPEMMNCVTPISL
jgi:hypothetical protein